MAYQIEVNWSEIKSWFIALAAALLSSLLLAFAQWLGAHIIPLVHLTLTTIAAYGGLKTRS